MGARLGRWLAVFLLLLAGFGCGTGELDGAEPGVTGEDTQHGDHGDFPDEDVEEVPPRPLTVAEMERYYAAQIAWRTCALDDGLELPDPPSLEGFVADGATWWVGYDLTDDEWNLMMGDESGTTGPGATCGEPPLPTDFRVEEHALRRFHAFQLDLVACLAEQGLVLQLDPPTEDTFVEAGGRGWHVWTELSQQHHPSQQVQDQLEAACGSSIGELPSLDIHSFELDRSVLEARFEEQLELRSCLEAAGFVLSGPPDRNAYLDGAVGTYWDLWGDAYRRNDRDELSAFADGLDQGCPAAG
jgi:hypothetical protein